MTPARQPVDSSCQHQNDGVTMPRYNDAFDIEKKKKEKTSAQTESHGIHVPTPDDIVVISERLSIDEICVGVLLAY